jgi:pimeloyl-ACP methyl ester carboxylesterase
MTKVFVHGNPEVAAIWGPVVERLVERHVDDVVLLSPPGFGSVTPMGWGASMAEYAAWLVAALEGLGGGVDIVGHDWGAGHVLGVVASRPDLLRSYAVDCAGLIHPEYIWHDGAQAWQKPEVGEAVIGAMTTGDPDEMQATLCELGIPSGIAREMVAGMDAEMGRCILALYRSAAQPAMARLGDRVVAAKRPPGLVIDATDDAYVPSAQSRETAGRLGAEVVEFPGRGHWWMLEDPEAATGALVDFWSTLA